jgi:glycosyltransferase involved in cell wall biosynthesis
VKESLACNVPVVSVEAGDVRERIAGIDGCYIADPTPEDLADKVALVLEREKPVAGRGRVEDIALADVASRLCEIYTSVVDGARSRSDERAA